MKKFFDTEKKVKKILENIPITRKDDNFLYITYWKQTAPQVSFIEFFKNPSKYGGASYKCVERVRRKLQSKFPELTESQCADAKFEESMKYESYGVGG